MRYNVAMIQIEYFPIDNPCRQLCRFNRQHICKVCHRHRDEKKAWDSFSEAEKRSIIRKCSQRKLAYRYTEYRLIQQQKQLQAKPSEQLNLFKTASKKPPDSLPLVPQSQYIHGDSSQLSLFEDDNTPSP